MEQIADAAMASLERYGVPACRADLPGLYATTRGELTFNQLLSLACQLDPAFDPGRFLNTPLSPPSAQPHGRS